MFRYALYGSSLLMLLATQIGAASASLLLTVSPGAIDFGDVLVGTWSFRPLTVSESGDNAVNGSFGEPSAPFSGLGSSFHLETPRKSAADWLIFSPGIRGPASGSVQVGVRAGDGPGISVSLSGTGVAPVNSVVAGPMPVTRIGTSGTESVTVRNVGDGNRSGLGLLSNLGGWIGGGSGRFSGPGGILDLADGASRIFGYTFTPTAHGLATASISALFLDGSSDGRNRGQIVPVTLQGEGVGPVYHASAAPGATLNFGKVQFGHTSVLDLMLSNIGTDAGSGSLTALSLLSADVTGRGADGFKLAGFTPTVLGEGENYDVKIDFHDNNSGRFAADLTIGTDQDAAFGAAGNDFVYHLVAQSVPEPVSLGILGFGALALLGIRRRMA